MRQISIDIEALGQSENAIILSIGAVAFDSQTLSSPGFYTAADVQDQVRMGRTITGDTVKWWMLQNEAARKAAFLDENTKPLSLALQELALWYGKDTSTPIWAKPSTYDITILNNAFKMCGLRLPWHYRSVRCLSTLMRTFPAVKPEAQAKLEHHAYDDAVEQALFIQKLLEKTGGKR